MTTSSSPPSSQTLAAGILGSGQLAAMLAEAADALGLSPVIFASSPDDPAVRCGRYRYIVGHKDVDTLAHFLSASDLVCIDQELDGRTPLRLALEQVIKIGDKKPLLIPSIDTLEACSDKLAQKRRLQAAGVPTPQWEEWDPRSTSVETWLGHLESVVPDGAVLKVAHGGYDGRGTFLIKNWRQNGVHTKAAAFCTQAAVSERAVYGEAFVPFVHELAVISTRWGDGRMQQFPTVLTTQRGGVCAEVRGPAEALGVAAEVTRAAEAIACRIGELFDLIGTYAVEFFLSNSGILAVNEIAPRVHNSGHFSLTAADSSQFENHWRAVLDLEPRKIKTAEYWGMLNILGKHTITLRDTDAFKLRADGIDSYWYGKTSSRPGRKLGHVNIAASDASDLERRMMLVSVAVDQWHQSLAQRAE